MILYTEDETAKLLKVSTSTIQKWRRQGNGPQFVQLGTGTIRYREEDLHAYAEGRAKGGYVPEHVTRAMKRAASCLEAVSRWKVAAPARKTVEDIRDELRSLSGGL